MRARRLWAAGAALTLVWALLTLTGPTSHAEPAGRFGYQPAPGGPQLSGAADPGLISGGRSRPAGLAPSVPAVAASDDIQTNGDNKRVPRDQYGSGAGFPANEGAIAINPMDPDNVIAGANDYAPGVDSVMGLYASFDGGRTWPYSGQARQVITPDRRILGGGDPVIAFDRAGVAYAGFISFGRADCDSYVAVSRSTDGGVTWTVPVGDVPLGTGLAHNDGIVVHNGGPVDCRTFHDKEWLATGPRPPGVPLVPGTNPGYVSPDRLYVTWIEFDYDEGGFGFVDSPIVVSYSDDQGRNWSVPAEISGSSPLCAFATGDADGACDEDGFPVPVVDPRNGHLYVAFQNSNVDGREKSQYLMVRSIDGGQSFEAPRLVAEVFDGDDKYPVCEGRQTLDLMCARTNSAGNIDVDPNTGRLYLTFSDNRHGTAEDTNTDVFVTTSGNGGRTWSQPRNITRASIDDQWFPWLSVAPDGVVAVTYFDRRYGGPKLIDTSLSVSINNGVSFTTRRVSEQSWNADLAFRLGLFIGDYNAVDTVAGVAIPCWTDARFGEPDVQGNNPPNQQSDIMVDVEVIPTR